MGKGRRFEVVEVRSGGGDGAQEDRVARLVALGQALSGPIRVRMLGMMRRAAVAATCRTSAPTRTKTRHV